MLMFCRYYLLLPVVFCSATFEPSAVADKDDPLEIEMFTYEVKPYVSGIRVVSHLNRDGFITYSEAGISVIYPETKVRIIIFGFHLDRIAMLSFTTDNCLNSVLNITHPEFLVQTDKRLDFLAQFHESDTPYRICFKERLISAQSDDEEDMVMIDEMRTWISAETPVQIYYLPIYVQMGIIFVLFCLSSLFSGLNLGLMSLSPQELMLIQKSGSPTEQKYATAILPVRESGNYLLCTVLIMNVVVNAAIAILFEDITNGMLAFAISSVGIVIFGEIVPQSICIKKGLAVGAYTIWLTRAFMIITFPLSYPISKILDVILGEETPVYDRVKLINLMKMTTSEENQELAADLKIAVGAMEIYEKTVGDVLTKIEDVFMLPESLTLDAANIAEIVRRGYTRIPVYEDDDRNQIVSLLMVRDLALIDPDDNFTVKTVCESQQHPLRIVDESMPLHTMLDEFKAGDYHLAIVESVHSTFNQKTGRQYKEKVGIVTLEDIVEEILQAEIVDESDTITDNVYRARRIYKKEPNITKILASEEFSKLSVVMETMVIHFLKSLHPAFTSDYVDERALSHLLRKNVKQVDLTLSPRICGNRAKKPETVSLLRQNDPSYRFILILEGKASAVFDKMEFEAGPWSCFGTELLDQLDEFVTGDPLEDEDAISLSGTQSALVRSIQFTPDFELKVSDFCRFVQITVPSYLNAFKVTKMAREARDKGCPIGPLLKASMRSHSAPRSRRVSETLIKRVGSKTSFDGLASGKRAAFEKQRSNSDYGRHLPAAYMKGI